MTLDTCWWCGAPTEPGPLSDDVRARAHEGQTHWLEQWLRGGDG